MSNWLEGEVHSCIETKRQAKRKQDELSPNYAPCDAGKSFVLIQGFDTRVLTESSTALDLFIVKVDDMCTYIQQDFEDMEYMPLDTWE